jgi:hypothetical protein
VAEEFVINSSAIETKINQLLPSQGGFQPGVDFSASTMVIPIIDLTETAEGSGLRQDLQSAFSHGNSTHTEQENSTATIVNTTGYYRCLIAYSMKQGSADRSVKLSISDGTTTKIIFQQTISDTSVSLPAVGESDIIVFLGAGESLIASSGDTQCFLNITTRQIASISGTLSNPT